MNAEEKISYKNVFYPPGGILMWIIIFLELITFGIALIAMVDYGNKEPELFRESSLQLQPLFGVINTVFLITSGYFMAVSVHKLKASENNSSFKFLKLTMLFGLLFLVLKAVEYYLKINSGLTMGYNTFFTFYWSLTLFHVIHVLVGLVILSTFYFSFNKSAPKLEDYEASAAFWHMCELIWLLLFPVIYLLF